VPNADHDGLVRSASAPNARAQACFAAPSSTLAPPSRTDTRPKLTRRLKARRYRLFAFSVRGPSWSSRARNTVASTAGSPAPERGPKHSRADPVAHHTVAGGPRERRSRRFVFGFISGSFCTALQNESPSESSSMRRDQRGPRRWWPLYLVSGGIRIAVSTQARARARRRVNSAGVMRVPADPALSARSGSSPWRRARGRSGSGLPTPARSSSR
jgi:hypothetical protein